MCKFKDKDKLNDIRCCIIYIYIYVYIYAYKFVVTISFSNRCSEIWVYQAFKSGGQIFALESARFARRFSPAAMSSMSKKVLYLLKGLDELTGLSSWQGLILSAGLIVLDFLILLDGLVYSERERETYMYNTSYK